MLIFHQFILVQIPQKIFTFITVCYVTFIFLKFIRLLPIYPQRASSIDFFHNQVIKYGS